MKVKTKLTEEFVKHYRKDNYYVGGIKHCSNEIERDLSPDKIKFLKEQEFEVVSVELVDGKKKKVKQKFKKLDVEIIKIAKGKK